MKALQLALLVVFVMIIARNPGLAADLAYGEYLAAECITCHRAAVDEVAIPAIVGLPIRYFVGALRDFAPADAPTPSCKMSSARSMTGRSRAGSVLCFARRERT